MANVRSAYAEISTAALTESDKPTDTTNIKFDRTGTQNAYVYKAEVTLTQKEDGWKTADAATAVAGVTATGSPTANGKATITVTEATGKTTIAYE